MSRSRRSRSRRLIVAVILAVVFCGALPAVAGASPQSDLKRTRAKITAAKKEKSALKDQICRLDARLNAIESRLASLGGRIDSVGERLAVTREKLEALQRQLRLKRVELRKAERALALEERNFGRRVVVAYKTPDLSYVDVVLESTSFEDLISRVRLVCDLMRGNNELVARLEGARDTVEREKRAIASAEHDVHAAVNDLETRSAQLVALRDAQAASKAAARAARAQKSGALAAVNDDLAELERQEDQLVAESNQLAGVISGSQGGGGGSGSLVWPTSGPVTSSFGWRTHPILHVQKFHTGIDIGAGYGAAICAADGGTVIYATWMSGYGNVTIVDHGGGLSTLYAHQATIGVGVGAGVSRGEAIGSVGSTGFSTGPHLHFEVRVNGNPRDPLAYLP